MVNKFRTWFGSMDFYKQVMVIAFPLMMQQVIMSSVNLIDNLMVGQLGDAAIGGVGVVNRYYMIVNFGANGFVSAVCIFLAQFFGAGDEEHAKQTFRFSVFGTYAIVIPFTLLGIFAPELIVRFFTNDVAYVNQGLSYFKIVVYSFIPAGLTMIIAGAMRSCGEIKIPLFANVFAVFVNTVLNYILIFGKFGAPSFGVAGAAIATLVSRVVEALILLYALIRNDYMFKTRVSDLFHTSKELSKKIVAKAVPLVTNEVLFAGGMALLLKLYATRGADVITACSVASTMTDIFFSLFGGMAGATTIIIGQKLGANQLDEARENGYHLISFATLLAFVFAIVMFGCSIIVPSLYDLTPETKQMTTNLIRVIAAMFWIFMLNAECFFIMRAGGQTRDTLLMDSCFMWLVNIPCVAAVAYFTDLNIYFVYTVGQVTDLLKLAVSFHFIKKERWVRNLTHVEEI